MDNAKFRDLLTRERDEKTPGPGGSADTPEARAAKKAKKQAEYERRMAIQKRREEALAEANKYHDRAADRRKEMEKQLKESGGQPEAFVPKHEQEQLPAELFVSSAPTFAQGGERADLSKQQHRLSIEHSKYLGGDIEHTHLVKGLDFALLQKMRSELASSEAEEEAKRALKQHREQARANMGAGAASGGSARKVEDAVTRQGSAAKKATGGSGGKMAFATELGRDVYRAVFSESSRPNRALTEGRLVLVFDVSVESNVQVPASVTRAADDLSGPRKSSAKIYDAGLPDSLLSRLSKVMAYSASGGGGERPKKLKKEKPLLSGASLLAMRPLPSRTAEATSQGRSAFAPAAPSQAALSSAAPTPSTDAARLSTAGKRSRWGMEPDGAAADAPNGATAPAATSSALGKAVAPSLPPSVVEDDVDDIFGDGVGSDYVCQPSAEQLKRAMRESADASLIRSVASSRRPASEQLPDAPEAEDEAEDWDAQAPPLAMDDAPHGGEANALLKQAFAGRAKVDTPAAPGSGGHGANSGKGGVAVVHEDDMADEDLLRSSAAKKAGAQPPASMTKDLKMSSTMQDDSYGECFPDTFEGYNLTLGGGADEDEEAMIVRGSKETDDVEGGKGKGSKGGGKGRGVDVEALKREAKMDRELVQIEKLMEERKHKRQRRDDGGDGEVGIVDQNEMF